MRKSIGSLKGIGNDAGGGLRIVHNVSALAKEASGPSYSVVRLCESLEALGDQVTLLTLDWEPGTTVPCFARSFPLAAGPRRLGRSPAMYHWLHNAAQTDRFDLIHTHGLWMMTNVYPGWVTRRATKPLVISPRGTFTRYAFASGSRTKRLFWPLVQRPAIAHAACFHATSDQEYEDIRRLGFSQPVAVIPNGIDLPTAGCRKRGERRQLLFLARIHPNKGLDMLLPAWAALEAQFPQWDLRIVGSDAGYHGVSGYLDQVKGMARTLGIRRIRFDGALYGDAKMRAYREADLYVLPSYSENFGMTVAEALAQEVPAVVTQGAPWARLEEVGAGWWVELGEQPLTAALKQAMAHSRDNLDERGRRGREWMEREFNWSRIAGEMDATYRWLCDRSRPMPSVIRCD
jgi:glycosyltransferase involved in cell wall biosynthesis